MDQMLSDKDLQDVVKATTKVMSRWEKLALNLKITSGEIDVIKQSHPSDPEGCHRSMLDKWLRKDLKASWGILVAALEGMDENRIADDIRKQYMMDAETSSLLKSIENSTHLATSTPKQGSKFTSARNTSASESTEIFDDDSLKMFRERQDSGIDTGSQGSFFKCRCGECTLESYISEGCPAALASEKRFPFLDTPAMPDIERQWLEAKLLSEFEEIDVMWDDTLALTLESFQQRTVSVELIRMHIKTLKNTLYPPKSPKGGSRKGLPNWKSLVECFEWLADYMSWFNSKVLEQLVKHCGTHEDKQRMANFLEARRQFLERKIFEIPHDAFGMERTKNSNRLVVKMDKNGHTQDGNFLVRIQSLLIKTVDVHAELLTVGNGCLELTFQIPEVIPNCRLSAKKQRSLRLEEVQSVKVISSSGEETVFISKAEKENVVINESEDSGFDSPVSCCSAKCNRKRSGVEMTASSPPKKPCKDLHNSPTPSVEDLIVEPDDEYSKKHTIKVH